MKVFRGPVLIVAALMTLAGAARAADSIPEQPLPKKVIPTLNTNAVADFVNGWIPPAMRTGKIPGAAVSVVQDGRVIFEKGYGVANVESREPVSVSNTVFRVASISKIMTAASVLELVHAHLLKLHRNVNDYLTGLHIAPAFGVPITPANLLTHSSGFDVNFFGEAARTARQKLPLRDYLVQFQPARLRPPGLFSGYDNYGYSLAGYLVQKVSGIPFPKYVQQHLLQPLDMQHSSFSPDAALRKQMATGYWLDGDVLRACKPSYVNITPAAGLCSTAADMSRFLAALLTNRRPDGARAFPSGVMAGLETQQFDFSSRVPGRCYGFDELTLAGHRVFRQTGDWPGFNALLLVFPKQNCGLFIAYNLRDNVHMGWQMAQSFANHFFPAKATSAGAMPLPHPTAAELEPLCGSYLSVRYPQDSPDLGIAPGLQVIEGRNGLLKINGTPYREIAPLVFQQTAPDRIPGTRVAFRQGKDGRIADVITETSAFRRAPWSETKAGYLWLIRSTSLMFLSVLILWPAAFLVRSMRPARGLQPPVANRGRRRFSWLAQGTAFAACLLAIWFEIGLALTERQLGPFADIYGVPSAVRALFGFMPVFVVLTGALAIFSVLAWRKKLWSFAHRLHYTLLPLAFIVWLYIFQSQHLLFIAYTGNGYL